MHTRILGLVGVVSLAAVRAVIDPQFNTTDVCVIVQTDAVTDKYYRHYEREARGGREPEES